MSPALLIFVNNPPPPLNVCLAASLETEFLDHYFRNVYYTDDWVLCIITASGQK